MSDEGKKAPEKDGTKPTEAKAEGKAEETPKAEEKPKATVNTDGKPKAEEEPKATANADDKPKAEEKPKATADTAGKPKVEEKPKAAAKPKPAPKPKPKPTLPEEEGPVLHVAPSPHVVNHRLTTRGLMLDVVVALGLPVIAALWFFRWHAVFVLAVTTVSCMAFEWIFVKMRGQEPTLTDLSAVVTGLILGLSLPGTTPWWICVIAAMVAMGLGKVVYGSIGQNIFNPAMVGRAFVMISFSAYLGAGAYVDPEAAANTLLSQATPLTTALAGTKSPDLWFLFLGNTNGSLGETSIFASLLGGLILCIRRTASWEVPAAMVAAMVVLAGGTQLLAGPNSLPQLQVTLLQHLFSGAFVFGAFYIATDPVTNPITAKGKFWFGAGVSFFVWLLRVFSNYPEGLMFAILLMNSAVPLINRWTVPMPFGGPVPERK